MKNLVEELQKLKDVKYNYAEGKVKIYQVISGFQNNYITMEIFTENAKYICHIKQTGKFITKNITKEYSYLAPLLKYIIQFSRGKS